MRIIYPEDVNIALDICASYITYSKKDGKMVFKENTPLKIKELYKETHKRIEDVRKSEQ